MTFFLIIPLYDNAGAGIHALLLSCEFLYLGLNHLSRLYSSIKYSGLSIILPTLTLTPLPLHSQSGYSGNIFKISLIKDGADCGFSLE